MRDAIENASAAASRSLASDAVQHLAERTLQLAPILLLREQLVDRLERLEHPGRLEVERLIEATQRLSRVLELVAQDHADRVRVLGLGLGALIERRHPIDDLDRLRDRSRLERPIRGACCGTCTPKRASRSCS